MKPNYGFKENIQLKDVDDLKINRIVSGKPDFISPERSFGSLDVRIIDGKTKKVIEEKHLGKNLVTNNCKLVLTHLLAQAPCQESGFLSNIKGFDPRLSFNDGGSTQGGVQIDAITLNTALGGNPASKLKITYMAFGTNSIQNDEGEGVAINQYGLYNAVSRTGSYALSKNEPPSDYTVENFFYGGTTMVYQYTKNDAQPSEQVSDATIRFITRMATHEGQPTGGQIIYKEAGLFTTLFYPHSATNGGTQYVPLMVARKVFAGITKDESVELEFVWTFRF